MIARSACSILLAAVAFAFAFALTIPGYAQAGNTNPDYALVDRLPLQGATRWDYLAFDPQGHRLFITRGDSVDVLDVTTQQIVDSIPDTAGVHGVALAPDLGKGFISDGAANNVTIFDLANLQTIETVPTGNKPDAIVYDPKSKRVFTANGNSSDVTAIDATNGAIIDTIKLAGKPEFAVVDGKGHLYINIEDQSHLVVIDSQSLKIVSDYDLSPNCDSPTGLAIDTHRHRLFSVCGNQKMVVVQAGTGKILDTLAIGTHSDAAVFDPGTQLAFSSNGGGTLTVVGTSSGGHYKVLQTVATAPTARTMALDPTTHKLYLAAAETDGIDPFTARPRLKPDSFMILTVALTARK